MAYLGHLDRLVCWQATIDYLKRAGIALACWRLGACPQPLLGSEGAHCGFGIFLHAQGCVWDCNSEMARRSVIGGTKEGFKEWPGSVNGSEPVVLLDLCAAYCITSSGRIRLKAPEQLGIFPRGECILWP